MRLLAWCLAAVALVTGCDRQRAARLEPGVSTEADVRARFGTPDEVWDGRDGSKTLEYDRNPQGRENYMITIGADGKMRALRQVLEPSTFAEIHAGMSMEEVRRMLGRPARKTPYPLRAEEAWDWRYLQPPNTAMVFTVWFDPDLHVVRTSTEPDPDAPENKGGPSGR